VTRSAVDHVSRVDAVRAELGTVVDELESDPSMDTPVPTCEHWTVEDLVVHIGAFCGFWTHVLCEGTGRPLTPYPDPPDGAALIPWLDDLGAHLVAELEATPATTEVWTWFAADHTAGFVARRCAHELAVHRYDLQSAHGTRQPIPTALAVDGIEEILGALVTTRERTGAGTGRAMSLRCTDAPAAWSVVMESNRIDVDRAATSDGGPAGDLRVVGTASDLELTLYHRPTLSPVDVNGDYTILEEWHREFTF
jgi:uncharacterized protein (TIGR03083 family)